MKTLQIPFLILCLIFLSPILSAQDSPEDREFSLVLLPDTQNYTVEEFRKYNLYEKQARWILENREAYDIRFVIHLGDVTDHNSRDPESPGEWEVADRAHRILDEAEIPYSMTTGNHDYYWDEGFFREIRKNVFYRQSDYALYFGRERFDNADHPWYGGSYSEDNISNYMTFSAGGEDFLILSLEFNPRKQVLNWADRVIRENPDRKVIVVTHNFIDNVPEEAPYSLRNGIRSWGDHYNMPGLEGEDLVREFLDLHSSIFLVLSGHVAGSGHREISRSDGFAPVHALLTDFQSEETAKGKELGNGWLRVLHFRNSPEGNTEISIEDVSILPPEDPYFKKIFRKGKVRFNFQESYRQEPLTLNLSLYEGKGSLPLQEDYKDFTLSPGWQGQNRTPSAAGNRAGYTVAVWQSEKDGESRILSSRVAPGGLWEPPFAVNPEGSLGAINPKAAMDEKGFFAVTWQEQDDSGSGDVYLRLFSDSGSPATDPLQVNETSRGDQSSPVVAFTGPDQITVAWQDDRDSNGMYNIYRKVFSTQGRTIVPEEKVNQTSLGQQIRPEIASNGNTSVIVWEYDVNRDRRFTVHARAYGENPFSEKELSPERLSRLRNPSVALSREGLLALAWQNLDTGKSRVEARLYDPRGNRIQNLVPGKQLYPSVAPRIAFSPEGMVILSWQMDKTHWEESEILYNVFDPQGRRVQEGAVNTDSTGDQIHPDLIVSDGTFRVVWQDDRDKDGEYQILMRSIAFERNSP